MREWVFTVYIDCFFTFNPIHKLFSATLKQSKPNSKEVILHPFGRDCESN